MAQKPTSKHLVVGVDLDGMLLAFMPFFKVFFACLQAGGNKVGILTARPEHDKEENLAQLKDLGITPDFYVGKPDDTNLPDGVFKAAVCTKLGIDLLFDDFESSNPQMLGDFFATNATTVPFTSWAYDPKGGE